MQTVWFISPSSMVDRAILQYGKNSFRGVKKMVKEQNDWMKKEFRQRMKEEKELLKAGVVLND